MNVECLGNPRCVFDANLTQPAFFALWDVAHRTTKAILPGARLIGPSIADGGPGLFGWPSVFPWLQRFLLHTHAAGTAPDVLSWHVTMVAANATILIEHHAELTAWCLGQGIPTPAIGHNEVMGPAETLDAAANVAYLTALERLRVDHACRACWTDKDTGQSPCFDNTLDGLLTDDCPHGSPLAPGCEPLAPRPSYYVTAWYAAVVGRPALLVAASPGCRGNLVGFAAGAAPTAATVGAESSGNGSTLLHFGRFWQSGLANATDVVLEFGPGAVPAGATSCGVAIERVVSGVGEQPRKAGAPTQLGRQMVRVAAGGILRVAVSGVALRDAYRVDVSDCRSPVPFPT